MTPIGATAKRRSSRTPSRAGSSSTARSSTPRAAGSPAIPAGWWWPAASSCRSPRPSMARARPRSCTCRRTGEPPRVGMPVLAEIAWERRHRHMRMHTALHLLCSLVPFPVTGGSIGADESRLDFDISEAGVVDKDELTEQLMALVAADHPVTTPLDHRRGARRQSRPHPHHEREAADAEPAKCGSSRSASTARSTFSPAAARMSARPARSAASPSPRSKRRAGRTAASASAFAETA